MRLVAFVLYGMRLSFSHSVYCVLSEFPCFFCATLSYFLFSILAYFKLLKPKSHVILKMVTYVSDGLIGLI